MNNYNMQVLLSKRNGSPIIENDPSNLKEIFFGACKGINFNTPIDSPRFSLQCNDPMTGDKYYLFMRLNGVINPQEALMTLNQRGYTVRESSIEVVPEQDTLINLIARNQK